MSIVHLALSQFTDSITHLAAAPSTPAPTPASPGTVTVSSTGISNWLKNNALPIIILVIGMGLLGSSRKGDTSKVMLTIGLTVASLAVVAIGLDSALGLGIGKWALGLFGVQA
jgi:hypothetical protein